MFPGITLNQSVTPLFCCHFSDQIQLQCVLVEESVYAVHANVTPDRYGNVN